MPHLLGKKYRTREGATRRAHFENGLGTGKHHVVVLMPKPGPGHKQMYRVQRFSRAEWDRLQAVRDGVKALIGGEPS